MKNKYKISFLMAAHNEEKVIGKSLERLAEVKKDYPYMELLIGLDGCTDNTLKIVKEFSKQNKFVKFFELNERKGKQAVLEKLEPYVKGDIIIIHDADWVFSYKRKNDFINFLSVFDNPEIGGISDSFPAEAVHPERLETYSFGFLASGWGNKFLLEYIKKNFTKKVGELFFYQREKIKFYPFLDTYRRVAMSKSKHKKELRAGDHVERTIRLFNSGYKIVGFDNENWPHFQTIYKSQTIRDLLNQKVRGMISKSRIQTAYSFKIPFLGFYIPFMFYVIKKSFGVKRIRDFIAIYIYIYSSIYSFFVSKFKKKISTQKVWSLRIKR